MSTVQATIVHIKNAEDRAASRSHPVLNFLHDHQEAFDHGNLKTSPYTSYHTEDFTFTNTDGTTLPSGEESWKGMLESYAPFSEHHHEAHYCCVYETGENTWEMLGIAHIFANLHAPGEKTKKDLSGKEWDVEAPGAFVFGVVKDGKGEKGYRVKSMRLFGDGVPIVGEMMKRGMMKPEDLAK